MAKEKLYYKIGEACKILDIQPYVLRYWETEFSVLSPSKSKSGQRVYGEDDFQLIRRIKELLYEEGFTIAGAKKKLDSEIADGGPKAAPEKSAKPAKKAAKKAVKKTAAKASEDAAEEEDAAEPVDDGEAERLREGIGAALEEAQAILELLDD